jgi:Rieske Fe-S protein
MEYDERAPITAGRRAVLAAAGGAGIAVALGGCSTYDFGGGGEPPPADNSGAPGASGAPDPSGAPGPSAGASQGGGGGAPALAHKGDIPVGGGKIFPDQKVVITQPKAGEIKAFTAVCTHAGCIVANVNGGTINCTCHGSKYNIENGSVVNGPAPRPLAPRKINVKGDDISLG